MKQCNMILLIWLLAAYGMSNILVYGSIFQGLRNFFRKWGDNQSASFSQVGDFISGILTCPMCFSFHGGWFLSLTIYSPTFEIFGTPLWVSWFFDAILSSGAVWAINAVVEWFEENRPSK